MRCQWGGRINTYNWFLRFRDEYNDFERNIDLYEKCDPELIEYILNTVIRTARYMNTYQNLYKLYCRVNEKSGAEKVWIWQTNCVVNDFASGIAIDTELDDGIWNVVLLGRDELTKEKIKKLSKVIPIS